MPVSTLLWLRVAVHLQQLGGHWISHPPRQQHTHMFDPPKIYICSRVAAISVESRVSIYETFVAAIAKVSSRTFWVRTRHGSGRVIAVLYAPRARAYRIRRTSKRLTRDALRVIRTIVVPRLRRIRCADALGTYTRAMAPLDSCTLCPAGPDTTRPLHAQTTYARRFARDTVASEV